MAFSSKDILQEFVEASSMGHWSRGRQRPDADALLWQRVLLNRLRVQEWYKENAEYKKAYMKARRLDPEVKAYISEYNKTPERVAARRLRGRSFRASLTGKERLAAERRRRRADPVKRQRLIERDRKYRAAIAADPVKREAHLEKERKRNNERYAKRKAQRSQQNAGHVLCSKGSG